MSPALAAALLAAPAAETPRAFVERLYAGYRDGDYSPLARPGRVFARPLVAALREDRRPVERVGGEGLDTGLGKTLTSQAFAWAPPLP